MKGHYPLPLKNIIEQFSNLPGIGPKSAQRIAFYLLQLPPSEAQNMMETILQSLSQVKYCGRCFNFAAEELCEICKNQNRDVQLLCVVEDPRDISRIESTGEFKGTYHVLGGAINSMDGIGPDQLNISELVARVENEDVKEVVVATNPNSEGEYTALYIAQQLEKSGASVTRPASGLPMGGELEYADDLTLGRAMANRQKVNWD